MKKECQLLGITRKQKLMMEYYMVGDDHNSDISAKKSIEEQAKLYLMNRHRKWLTTCIGLIIGVFLGVTVPIVYRAFTNSLYDRRSLEGLMDEMIGDRNISDAMFNEILLVAYEYNSHSPRLYCKYNSDREPNIYDVKMSLATGGSSAAPIYFDP